jgi:hypothetical protein
MTQALIVAMLVALLALLAGCASTTPVIMRHPDGRTAQCGPYSLVGIVNQIQARDRERDCIGDYQRQGYERAPH